jgi:hypothetical protein
MSKRSSKWVEVEVLTRKRSMELESKRRVKQRGSKDSKVLLNH